MDRNGDALRVVDEVHMRRATVLARSARGVSSPNPWVGCVVVSPDGTRVYEGTTSPPGGPHAEVVALEKARLDGNSRGSTLYSTLEPCVHYGRTPPCVDLIVSCGVARVVLGVTDPDPKVSGKGVAALRSAGIEVTLGVNEEQITDELAPYLKHRRTGRPWVILKLAASLDGRIGAPDGSSRWITGEESRRDAHRLRAVSDAVLVGAGTLRRDDPELTVRIEPPPARQPLRVVLGRAPERARVLPALEVSGELGSVLDQLGSRGVLQLLVEGGAKVAHDFHEASLVDRYVFYIAPGIFGGDDATPMFSGKGARTIDGLWRGKLVSIERLGEDLRVEVAP